MTAERQIVSILFLVCSVAYPSLSKGVNGAAIIPLILKFGSTCRYSNIKTLTLAWKCYDFVAINHILNYNTVLIVDVSTIQILTAAQVLQSHQLIFKWS